MSDRSKGARGSGFVARESFRISARFVCAEIIFTGDAQMRGSRTTSRDRLDPMLNPLAGISRQVPVDLEPILSLPPPNVPRLPSLSPSSPSFCRCRPNKYTYVNAVASGLKKKRVPNYTGDRASCSSLRVTSFLQNCRETTRRSHHRFYHRRFCAFSHEHAR